MNNENQKIPQTVRDAIMTARAAHERTGNALKSLAPNLDFIKNMKVPIYNLPKPIEIELGPGSDVMREQNQWERHAEMLEIQTALLKTQHDIISDQKSNRKFVITGLIVSGLAAFFSAVAIIPMLREWFK